MTNESPSLSADQNGMTAISTDIPSRVFQDSLKTLGAEFKIAAQKYGPLYHQQLIQPHFVIGTQDSSEEDGDWSSATGWAEFATANSPLDASGWQKWHGPVVGLTYEWFGRFFGDPSGFDEFCFLAESLYIVLRKLNPQLPDVFGFELLLDLMHQAAASWPTTLLRSKESEWGLDDTEASILESNDTTVAECDAIWNEAEVGPNGVPFFVHPTVETIQGNLFLAAAQFAKMVARDDLTLFLSDVHPFEPDYPTVPSDAPAEADSGMLSDTHSENGDYVFAFDEPRQVWHVRFRYDKTSDAIEEGWLHGSKGMLCIAHLLERPKESVPCTSILPPPAPVPTGTNESPVGAEMPQSRNTWARHARKRARETQAEHDEQIRVLTEMIKDARHAGDLDRAAELEDSLNFLRKDYNRQYDMFGRDRRSTNRADQNAANKVRNNIQRIVKKCLGERCDTQHPLKRFAEHIDAKIDFNGGYACYGDDKRWQVSYPLGS